jgi:hypothetical protein
MLSLTYSALPRATHLSDVTDHELLSKLKDKSESWKHYDKLSKERYNELYEKFKRARGNTRIVNDAAGKIGNILLTVPAYYNRRKPDEKVYSLDARTLKTLIAHLSHHKRYYTVLCQVNQVDVIEGWFKEHNISSEDYVICTSVFNYSLWAQDAYLALHDEKDNIILGEGICFIRDHDMCVADDLFCQTDILTKMTHLYFQGGNILQAGDHVIIGRDYIVDNSGRIFLETQEKVIKEFELLLGYPVISLGTENIIPHVHRMKMGGGVFQPVFHIDMYVTPTAVKGKDGKEIVFVGSPALARMILDHQPRESDHTEYFDEAADQLSQYYDVRRLPLLPTSYLTDRRKYYYLSYNNCIVENYHENRQDVRNVYLPTYRQDVETFKKDTDFDEYNGDEHDYEKLDDAAKKIWESIGYTVYQMDGLEDLAMSWGSVHCIAKTLKRMS